MTRFLSGLGRAIALVLGWGLALLAFLVVLSFVGCSVQVKRSQAQEAARLAECHWTDPVIVSVSGRVLAVPATGRSSITVVLGDPPLTDEPIDGSGVWPRRYSFCLDGPQTEPVEATRIHISSGDELVAFAEPFDLNTEHLLQIGIYSDGPRLYDWPSPEPGGDPASLSVFRSVEDVDRLSVAAGGFDADGFRTGARCTRTHDDRRSCTLWVEDAGTGLSYEFMSLWIDDRDFDGAPVPEGFRDTALKLRALIIRLEADAVGRPGGPD